MIFSNNMKTEECKAVKYRDWGLYLIFIAVHLFVFMPMLFRFGYRWDEVLDFTGAATDTYVGSGRWMQAVLRYVLGKGVHPWSSSFLACAVLSAASVMQCRIFKWGSFFRDVAYGVMMLAIYQYAFVMQYAHQSDTIAIGILMLTLALQLLIRKGWTRDTAAAALIVGLAISIYQSLGLYMVGLLLVWGMLECARGDSKYAFKVACKSAAVIAFALLLWKCGKVASLEFIGEETQDYCRYSQESMSNSAGFLMAPVGYTAHYGILMAKRCFSPDFKMEWLYSCTVAAVLLIAVSTLRLAVSKLSKLVIILSSAVLWLLPFFMILALGNEWPCKPHTRLAEPLAFAGLWSIAGVLSAECFGKIRHARRIISVVLVFIIVRAGMCVSDIAKKERALFEGRVYNIKQMEREADALAERVGMSLNSRYVFFDDRVQYEHGSVDFTSSYPAWTKISTAQRADYERHKAVLDEMPNWPQDGSIRFDNGKIIIKGSNYGGTQEIDYNK